LISSQRRVVSNCKKDSRVDPSNSALLFATPGEQHSNTIFKLKFNLNIQMTTVNSNSQLFKFNFKFKFKFVSNSTLSNNIALIQHSSGKKSERTIPHPRKILRKNYQRAQTLKRYSAFAIR
jgi:hypothetical protein